MSICGHSQECACLAEECNLKFIRKVSGRASLGSWSLKVPDAQKIFLTRGFFFVCFLFRFCFFLIKTIKRNLPARHLLFS